MDNTLQLFRSKKEEIEEFKKIDLELLRYISTSVFNIMEENGFQPNSTRNLTKYKHFNANIEFLNEKFKENVNFVEKFRFWVELSHLRYNASFEAFFELSGKKIQSMEML